MARLILVCFFAGAAGQCPVGQYYSGHKCADDACWTGSECILCSSHATANTCPFTYCTWTGSLCGGRPAQLDPCSSFSKSSCPPQRCILEGEACSVRYHHYPSTNCGSGGSEFLGMSVATAEACLALCPGCEAVLWWPYLERECLKCLDPATREHDSGMSPGPSMVLVHSSVNQATFTTTALPTTTLSTVTTTSNTMDLSCSHLNKASCQKPRCHWTGVSCEWGYFDYAGMKCGDQEFLKMSIAAAEGCLALCPDCVVEWWEEGEQACSKCLSGLQWYDGSDFAAPPHVLVPRSLAFPSPFLPMNATSAQGAFACRGAHPNDNSFAYYKVVPDFSGDLTSCKAHCAAMRGLCKGVEYSPGRCELWTRPEGIGAVASLPSGHFQCLRYAAAPVFELVNGADQVCRGASISDNSPNYFSVIAVSNLRDCQERCMEQRWPKCMGIEYSFKRCELWNREIKATLHKSGNTCMRLVYGVEANYLNNLVYP